MVEGVNPETDEDHPPEWQSYVIGVSYAVAIVLNLWVLWDFVKDKPEGLVMRARIGELWARAKAPCQRCRERKAALGRMFWEAERVIAGEEI